MKIVNLLICLLITTVATAQFSEHSYVAEVNGFRGNIMLHSPDMHHLITDHPAGTIISLLRKTDGSADWHSIYNYPEYGGYFLRQDFRNEYLGKNYALGVQYNFYFLNRNLQLKVSQGLAMTTRKHDNATNYKNNAFGTRFMENTNFGVAYSKQGIFQGLGIRAGFLFTHFSNGKIKSPNSGVNTYNIDVGVTYDFGQKHTFIPQLDSLKMKYKEPIKYNIILRSGVNEGYVINSGQKPFYHIATYADKRLNRKSAVQFGTDIFLTLSQKEIIKFKSIAYPESGITADLDYKRVGVFIGHELFINRISVETQVGYYVYNQLKTDGDVYDRVGMKYYITPKIFAGVGVKTHGFLAEAVEFSVGVRL